MKNTRNRPKTRKCTKNTQKSKYHQNSEFAPLPTVTTLKTPHKNPQAKPTEFPGILCIFLKSPENDLKNTKNDTFANLKKLATSNKMIRL